MDDSLELWLSDEDHEAARTALASRGVTSDDLLVRHRAWSGSSQTSNGRIVGSSIFAAYCNRRCGARLLIIGGTERADRMRGRSNTKMKIWERRQLALRAE